MGMNYFDNLKNQDTKSKTYLAIIAGLLIVNLLEFKGLMTIASNKEVHLQVPQFMEKGDYVIGSTYASKNVYSMWARTWIKDLGNYSYENIDQKIKDIYPFLDGATAFENKSKLLEFASFVKNNFVTQSYDIEDIKVTEANDGYMIVETVGTLKRQIGKKEDELSGLKYTYKLICFARNGQIWIKNMETYITEQQKSVTLQKKLDQNSFVNFDTNTKAKSIEAELKHQSEEQRRIEFIDKPAPIHEVKY